MSDYLWDKTGEPDADAEQLENLLGALKYQPRPLEMPDAMPSAMPPAMSSAIPSTVVRPRFNRFTFSRPRLAIAASLILMLLMGAWLVSTRQRETQPLIAQQEDAAGAQKKEQSQRASGSQVATGSAASADTASVNTSSGGASLASRENMTARQQQNAARFSVVNQTHRQARRVMARQSPRGKEHLTPHEELAGNSAPQAGAAAITEEGREATEKLMLALRLASAKLNYAQREVQEISRAAQ